MAKILVQIEGLENRLFELKLGVNRVGRNKDNDFSIPHSTVSSLHCELILSEDGVTLRDLDSTNGCFVEDQRVTTARLEEGQRVRLGDVELLVESTEFKVAIPQFVNTELPAPPVVAENGSMICPRHPQAQVSHRCTHCKEVMCPACVHRLRRRGGKIVLLLCPICSSAVEPIGGAAKAKKKSLLSRVGETVRLKFTRSIRTRAD